MPLYAIDKPLGLSSHGAVARARRLLGTRKVGHAGTLDPLATGVLLLLTHEATKLSQFVTGHDKSYLAWVTLGVGTPTLDAEGPVDDLADASGIDRQQVLAALPPFLNLSEQRPPAYSAVKQAGVRNYAAARRGDVSEPPARPAAYREVTLLALEEEFDDLPRRFSPTAEPGAWRPNEQGREFTLPPRLPNRLPNQMPNEMLGELPTAEGAEPAGPRTEPAGAERPGRVTALIALRVAAGTYVRAFARDLGRALGVPAHLAGLVRTASGDLDLSSASELDALARVRDVPEVPVRLALDLPELTADDAVVRAVVQGQRPPLDIAERTALLDGAGDLIAVLDPDEARGFRVVRVFSRGS